MVKTQDHIKPFGISVFCIFIISCAVYYVDRYWPGVRIPEPSYIASILGYFVGVSVWEYLTEKKTTMGIIFIIVLLLFTISPIFSVPHRFFVLFLWLFLIGRTGILTLFDSIWKTGTIGISKTPKEVVAIIGLVLGFITPIFLH